MIFLLVNPFYLSANETKNIFYDFAETKTGFFRLNSYRFDSTFRFTKFIQLINQKKEVKKIILLIIISLTINKLTAHPLHVSVTNLEYDSLKKVFYLSIKLFQDDFQGVIFHLYGIDIKLGTAIEHPETEKLTMKYINTNFSVNFDRQKSAKLKLIEKNKDDMSVWLKFEMKAPRKFRSIQITNTIMNDYFLDQVNLFILTLGQKQIAEKFDFTLTNKVFELN